MKRTELLKSEGYWLAKLQIELYREVQAFMEKTKKNRRQLADYLGCTKSYISQLLNGNFDHKLSKLVELSLAIGKVPVLEFRDTSEYIFENDKTYSSSTFVLPKSEATNSLPDFSWNREYNNTITIDVCGCNPKQNKYSSHKNITAA